MMVTATAARHEGGPTPVPLPNTGRWRLRAYHSDAGHAAAWSAAYKNVTVK
jgi:hypothetical protein